MIYEGVSWACFTSGKCIHHLRSILKNSIPHKEAFREHREANFELSIVYDSTYLLFPCIDVLDTIGLAFVYRLEDLLFPLAAL